jgi:hypothetical protein
VVEYPIPLETSETKGVVVVVECPLPLKEGTAGAVVGYLDPVKEVVVAVVGDHLEVEEEEEKKNPTEVWDDLGEDL